MSSNVLITSSKNLAIVGASYLQLPLILKAKELGYVTHVFAWKANDVGEAEADYFYPISIIEKDEILRVCSKLNIVGICTIASDLAVITVNYVANKLGLNANSLDATFVSSNKHAMRLRFEQCGDPSPKSYIVSGPNDVDKLSLNFPLIVKPTDRSGSRGINKVNNIDELKKDIVHAIDESFEKKALVEEYVEGDEYSVEYISYKGKHTFLALTLKYTTGAPYFIETGHLEPAPISDDTLNKIKAVISHALDSLGITDGASHSEIKINSKGEIKIIEIGGRMGGDLIGSDLVYYSTGYDFIKMVINVACNESLDFTRNENHFPVMVKFILSEDDLKEFEYIRDHQKERLIKVVDFHPEKIGSTTDSSNRAGCYLLKA